MINFFLSWSVDSEEINVWFQKLQITKDKDTRADLPYSLKLKCMCVGCLESQLTSIPHQNGSVFTLALDLDSMAQPLTAY